MAFDIKGAERARLQNPKLTKFDTGEYYEPYRHDVFGETPETVDFDNDEGATELQVSAHPSYDKNDTIVVELGFIDNINIQVWVNGSRLVWEGTVLNA